MLDLTQLKPTLEQKPPRIIIYGGGGIGKSTFASDAPDVFFFDIEGGLDGIECAKQPIKTWDDAVQTMTALIEQDHSFKTVAVDSLDWVRAHYTTQGSH